MKTKEINGRFYQKKRVRFYSYPIWVEVDKPKEVKEEKPKKKKVKESKKEE